MPPKLKVTKVDIINTALQLVREHGEGAINARSIAGALGCSTQPIFSNFSSMEELEDEVKIAAYERYSAFIEKELAGGTYPPYKSYGMAYVRFADAERELFKLLFMCDRNGEDMGPTADFIASVDMIKGALDVDGDIAQLIHLEMWACVHGIATMLATSYLKLDWELISTMLTDVYKGVSERYLKNGSNKN